MAQSPAPIAYITSVGILSPKKGMVVGSTNSTKPPSTMPPRPKVREQNATVLAICSGVRPQWA